MDGGASSEACFGTWGGFYGGTWAPFPKGGTLTTSSVSGAWVFTGTVSTYSGAGLWFLPCVDASSFSGVEFTVKGDAGPSGTMLFYVTQVSNMKVATPGGACTGGNLCRGARSEFPVTGTEQTVKIPWSNFTGGWPNNAIDQPGELLDMHCDPVWSGTTYTVNVTIDNLAFYL
jgi:hypothetical protein